VYELSFYYRAKHYRPSAKRGIAIASVRLCLPVCLQWRWWIRIT